ncbi:hypothetical protein EJ06DRAFT_430995 [Trichodelitschia bisporula]|uniref:C3H1-type domain-containing protein n=1 Tax=Trichodelitschia bisporula TaxID=703511 RepID=A0A6G1HXI1_9PEZI|nr:hypothetical protein EJ06DRAFT_430995 [Trichodelitschia bisporula]
MMISNSSPATTPDTIGSSETSSSEYTDSEYESESSEEPSPLPQSRPHDALQAVRYDVIKAVWLPRNVASKPDTIRTALKEFWDVVRAIRDRWKTEMDALKKAGENKQDSQLPALKERVEKQRSAVEIALSTAVEFGHPAVMRLLSQNMPLILTMYQFLVDRVRENDYSGRAVVTICKFLLTCGLTSEALETGNLNKVFSRFTKRGSDEIKALVKQITEAAAAESKNAKPTSKPTKLEESKDGKGSETAVGVKRPRMDGANPPPAKRVAPTTASMDLGNKSTVPKRPTVPSSSSDKVASNPATKPKTPAAASSFFTSLPTAQTKTAPSTTAVASMKPKAKIGVPEKKRPVAAPGPTKPVFSFSETMANLTKAREPERTVKKEEKLPPETPEERAKRLRKEERRKLRVTWKTDAALVDVRYFSRDPSEFPGSSSNTRDVKDGKEKEGLAFKRHMDVTDIEEEDDQPLEHTFFEFTYPSLVDFSGVGEKEREINYERFGGQKKVESPERLAQEERETTTLMVTYFARSDIPPSPREPPNPYTGVPLETKMFGNPPDTVMQRMAALQPQQAPDIMNILKAIQGSQPEQPTEQSYQQPTLALQSSFQPPQPQPAAQPNSIESILAQMTGSSIAQPAPAAPQYAQYQAPAPVAQVQPPARGQESDIKSILEALNMHAQPMQQPTTAAQSFAPAATPSMSNSSAMEIMARLGVNVATIPGFAPSAVAPSSSSTQLFEHPERKRMREGDNSGSDQGPSSGKRAKWNGNRNPDKPKFIFPCRFWKDGRCKKGADCTYRHEPL